MKKTRMVSRGRKRRRKLIWPRVVAKYEEVYEVVCKASMCPSGGACFYVGKTFASRRDLTCFFCPSYEILVRALDFRGWFAFHLRRRDGDSFEEAKVESLKGPFTDQVHAILSLSSDLWLLTPRATA